MSLAFEQSSSGESQMQFRDHPAVQGKRDMYPVDPRKLKVDDTYNVRDMSSKETRDHIAWLKASITAPDSGGVHTPLEVRLDGKNIFVVAGHCRLAAVLEAIDEGHPIETVPCIPEAKGTSEIDRTVNLIVSNSGKALSPLEVAKVVKRLDGYGWSAKQIAERLGWKSVATVKQHLEMAALSEGVKGQVRAGNVSATTARHLAKSDLTPEQQEELIRANEEQNRRIKGKRTRVMPRHVKAATKPKPPKEPAQAPAEPSPKPSPAPAEAQVQSAPEPESVSQPVSHPQPIAESSDVGGQLDTKPVGFIGDELHEERPTIIGVDKSDGRDLTGIHFSPPAVKDLIEALAPFASLLADTSIEGRDDDDTIPIQLKHLKRAWEVYTKATGDDVRDAA
jgi:ParB-like chromosome segregation protein Spo0J